MILKKLINRSLGSVELGDQKKMLSYPVTIAKPNKKKKDTSSFLAKTHPMKSYGLFYYGLPNFLFLYKSILLSLPHGDLHMVHHGCITKCHFLLILNKPIFAGEISRGLFSLNKTKN